MKVLFLGRRHSSFRNFDSVLRELAERGHEIHLAIEREAEEGRTLVEELAAEFSTITYSELPETQGDDWSWVADRVRHGLEYLRYQHRMFDDTPKILDRSRERTPGAFVALGDFVGRYARWARNPCSTVLRWLERAAPENPTVRAFVERHQPDVVLFTPLINLGSTQIDYLRAARALAIPTALCVWSWDHLSSKALIREMPDRVFVWNDTQKCEAISQHGVPADRIAVTGAQCFDRWFGRQPSRDRESFCRDVGLPTEPPFILYVCSSPFLGSDPEAPFVVEWIRHVRAHASHRLRRTPILVRPHPSRRAEWANIDLRGFSEVVLWGGDNPIDVRSRANYFDSLYHSAVVVGLNTSAFIEAGILGRPVHTILLPQWHESQLGTVHFRYLFEAGGGLLTSAHTFDEHLRQIDHSLANPSTDVRPFIQTFVRPLGLDVSATPLFVAQVEQMRGMDVSPLRPRRFERLALWLLQKGIRWRDEVGRERLMYSEKELEGILRLRASRQEKAQREGERKRARLALREARDEARMRNLERHRAVKKAKQQLGKRVGQPPTVTS